MYLPPHFPLFIENDVNLINSLIESYNPEFFVNDGANSDNKEKIIFFMFLNSVDKG